jgi:hypothetical protein
MKVSLRWCGAAALFAAVTAIALSPGCDARKGATEKGKSTLGVATDADASTVAQLDSQQDSEQCHIVLRQLDVLPSASERPAFSESDKAELGRVMRLTPAELGEVSQTNFTSTDGWYLSECLLTRAGVKSLRLESRPPLEQARLSFDWVCRLIYIDDRAGRPVNPWITYEVGWASPMSRAYAVLSAWQQLGLDGCLVGPSSLKDTNSVSFDPWDPAGASTYAPVRACGVKIGKDLFLFNPTIGKAYPSADGKGVLTLAEARANPELALGQKPADEAKDWRPFLCPPLSALSTRIRWLEKYNPGSLGVKLHSDMRERLAAYKTDLPDIPCEVWNPTSDVHNPTRILGRVATEELSAKNQKTLRDFCKAQSIPLGHVPIVDLKEAGLSGDALEYVLRVFAGPFDTLRFAPNTPRDLMIRGQFQQANQSLDVTKQMVDNARDRMQTDRTVQKDFQRWAEQFRQLYFQVNLARERNPAAMPAAMKALDDFQNTPTNRNVERAFVLGHAARSLGAEVAFLLAACAHELAERGQLDNSATAAANWKNAAEWWKRFLDASIQAGSPFPAREPHARALLARCQQFTGK